MSELAKIGLSAVLSLFFTVWVLTVLAQFLRDNDNDNWPGGAAA